VTLRLFAVALAALPLAACARNAVLPAAAPLALAAPAAARPIYAGLDVPPRLQWGGNWGYCGETSMISAGLYYGQYASQYDARAIASPGVPQFKQSSQLLLGNNDVYAAAKMHLQSIEWHAPSKSSSAAFLAWVKGNVLLGRPVAIGVYTNEYRFYGKTSPKAGEATYDHIVPVTGIRTDGASSGYEAGDALTFSDNGLWSLPDTPPPYVFAYRFGDFQRSRAAANAKGAPIYSLPAVARNYGIAITGVIDRHHDTLPVRLSTNVNYERPPIVNGSTKRPKAMPLVLTITVSNLVPGVTYRLYRYDSFDAVPDSQFNARAARASERLTVRIASGSTYSRSERITSDRIAVYRAVRSTAP
jgi:hypothetical protein